MAPTDLERWGGRNETATDDHMSPSLPILTLLAAAALITSIISAIIGMGGGILLLAVMFCFLPHGQAIPVHAVVQLASNSTRIAAYFGSADRRAVGRFVCGVLPGSVLGAIVLWRFGRAGASEPYLKMIVGLYVLVATFAPQSDRSGAAPGRWWDFPLLGFVAGSLALTVGAVGPLIAPLFARRGFVKERLIATKAACQMVTHLIKLPAFVWLGTFALGELQSLALPMVIMVIPGTLLGRRLLRHVSPPAFQMMYRVALVVAGLKVLALDGIWRLVQPALPGGG